MLARRRTALALSPLLLCAAAASRHTILRPIVFPERSVTLENPQIAALYRFDRLEPEQMASVELLVRASITDLEGDPIEWTTTRVVLRDRDGDGVGRTLYLRDEKDFSLRLDPALEIGRTGTMWVRVYGNGRHRIVLGPESVSLRVREKKTFRTLSETVYFRPRVRPDRPKVLATTADRARFRFLGLPADARGAKLHLIVAVTDERGKPRSSTRTRILLSRRGDALEVRKAFYLRAGEATVIRLNPRRHITASGTLELQINGNGRDHITVTPDSLLLEIRR